MNSNVNVAAPAFSFQELSRALGNVDPQTTQLVMSGVGILQQKVQETEELRAKVAQQQRELEDDRTLFERYKQEELKRLAYAACTSTHTAGAGVQSSAIRSALSSYGLGAHEGELEWTTQRYAANDLVAAIAEGAGAIDDDATCGPLQTHRAAVEVATLYTLRDNLMDEYAQMQLFCEDRLNDLLGEEQEVAVHVDELHQAAEALASGMERTTGQQLSQAKEAGGLQLEHRADSQLLPRRSGGSGSRRGSVVGDAATAPHAGAGMQEHQVAHHDKAERLRHIRKQIAAEVHSSLRETAIAWERDPFEAEIQLDRFQNIDISGASTAFNAVVAHTHAGGGDPGEGVHDSAVDGVAVPSTQPQSWAPESSVLTGIGARRASDVSRDDTILAHPLSKSATSARRAATSTHTTTSAVDSGPHHHGQHKNVQLGTRAASGHGTTARSVPVSASIGGSTAGRRGYRYHDGDEHAVHDYTDADADISILDNGDEGSGAGDFIDSHRARTATGAFDHVGAFNAHDITTATQRAQDLKESSRSPLNKALHKMGIFGALKRFASDRKKTPASAGPVDWNEEYASAWAGASGWERMSGNVPIGAVSRFSPQPVMPRAAHSTYVAPLPASTHKTFQRTTILPEGALLSPSAKATASTPGPQPATGIRRALDAGVVVSHAAPSAVHSEPIFTNASQTSLISLGADHRVHPSGSHAFTPGKHSKAHTPGAQGPTRTPTALSPAPFTQAGTSFTPPAALNLAPPKAPRLAAMIMDGSSQIQQSRVASIVATMQWPKAALSVTRDDILRNPHERLLHQGWIYSYKSERPPTLLHAWLFTHCLVVGTENRTDGPTPTWHVLDTLVMSHAFLRAGIVGPDGSAPRGGASLMSVPDSLKEWTFTVVETHAPGAASAETRRACSFGATDSTEFKDWIDSVRAAISVSQHHTTMSRRGSVGTRSSALGEKAEIARPPPVRAGIATGAGTSSSTSTPVDARTKASGKDGGRIVVMPRRLESVMQAKPTLVIQSTKTVR